MHRKSHTQPVLILGAGRGGSALLEMFLEDPLVEVIAVADPNFEAPAIKMAKANGIPTYAISSDALQLCKAHPECIVYNLTHDESITDLASSILGKFRISGGFEAKLFWQMVTNLKRAKAELEKNQSQLQAIISNAIDGIITVNEHGEIQGFNPAAEAIFGYTQDQVRGKHIKILVPDTLLCEYESSVRQFLYSSQTGSMEIRSKEMIALRKSGGRFPMELSASEMTLGEMRYFIGIVRDITDRKLVEEKISFLAHHDYLTDLPNRALFLDRLEMALSLAKRSHCIEAILFMDLDGFKKVNDTLGHDFGDLLLKAVARRLEENVRDSDTVARIGGDEFTIILNNINSSEDALLVANKIIKDLSVPFDLDGQLCQIGVSIGIAIYPENGGDTSTLLKQADEAMYQSKQRGKNSVTYFSKARDS